MNGSEEGSESSPDASDQGARGRAPLYPVSKATKDFISFLEEGPPPDVQPARPAAVSSVSLAPTTKSSKSGSRLQRMISKLNLSKEDRTFQDSQRSRGVGSASAPSTPSMRSFGTSYAPPLPPPVKPVPPPMLSIAPSVPLSPPSSSQPSPDDDDARSPTSRNDRRPRKMSVRKAVPNWDTVGQGVPAPPSRDTTSPHVHTSSPSIASPASPIQNGRQSRLTPAPEAKEANGHTHDYHKSSRSDTPVDIPTPASIVLETPSHSPTPRENGNRRAEQSYSQGTSRPRSSRRNRRLSMNDEQPSPARRSSERQSQPSNHQPAIPAPSLPESLALDLRKLMSQATTADECRLLLDTFLTRAGFAPASSPVLDTTSSELEPLERILVQHLLGADPDDPQSLHFESVSADEAVQHPPSSAPGHPPGKDLHQSTTTPMDPENAVHAHHITSTEVAVVS
jgi:hypothetical protein